MALANNDYNWRMMAGEEIPANSPIMIDTDGKAMIATFDSIATCAVGISPVKVLIGDRVPVIRGGKLGGLSGFAAGAVIYGKSNGTLDDAPAGTPHFVQRMGYIPIEDEATMLIDIQDPVTCVVGS